MNQLRCDLRTLLNSKGVNGRIAVVSGEEAYVNRVLSVDLPLDAFIKLKDIVQYVGVTKNFREIIEYFNVPENETPAGFRIEYYLESDGVLRVDLVRDISYDKNGLLRPTNVLFSADSANPYEVGEIKGLLANLTCNPGIIYDLFINNPKANVGNRFKTREEVMTELGRVLGPGADISVEINNPFSMSEAEILEEAAMFKEILSPYRVVIKVPHTGPVNSQNVDELTTGSKKFSRKYDQGTTKDMLRGHNLALMLQEHGYRVNFTLMFEPYQTNLALQAKPYFINSFVRHRMFASNEIKRFLDIYNLTGDSSYLDNLRGYFIEKDYLSLNEKDMDLFQVKEMAERIIKYRNFENSEGFDGLDSVRHNLRLLRNCNLPDTRLIVCSMEGERNYPELDKLLSEDEFRDMAHKVVITAEPEYLRKFTSTPLVVTYQRRFMNAVKNGVK